MVASSLTFQGIALFHPCSSIETAESASPLPPPFRFSIVFVMVHGCTRDSTNLFTVFIITFCFGFRPRFDCFRLTGSARCGPVYPFPTFLWPSCACWAILPIMLRAPALPVLQGRRPPRASAPGRQRAGAARAHGPTSARAYLPRGPQRRNRTLGSAPVRSPVTVSAAVWIKMPSKPLQNGPTVSLI